MKVDRYKSKITVSQENQAFIAGIFVGMLMAVLVAFIVLMSHSDDSESLGDCSDPLTCPTPNGTYVNTYPTAPLHESIHFRVGAGLSVWETLSTAFPTHDAQSIKTAVDQLQASIDANPSFSVRDVNVVQPGYEFTTNLDGSYPYPMEIIPPMTPPPPVCHGYDYDECFPTEAFPYSESPNKPYSTHEDDMGSELTPPIHEEAPVVNGPVK